MVAAAEVDGLGRGHSSDWIDRVEAATIRRTHPLSSPQDRSVQHILIHQDLKDFGRQGHDSVGYADIDRHTGDG
jgi:hypothetical protein